MEELPEKSYGTSGQADESETTHPTNAALCVADKTTEESSNSPAPSSPDKEHLKRSTQRERSVTGRKSITPRRLIFTPQRTLSITHESDLETSPIASCSRTQQSQSLSKQTPVAKVTPPSGEKSDRRKQAKPVKLELTPKEVTLERQSSPEPNSLYNEDGASYSSINPTSSLVNEEPSLSSQGAISPSQINISALTDATHPVSHDNLPKQSLPLISDCNPNTTPMPKTLSTQSSKKSSSKKLSVLKSPPTNKSYISPTKIKSTQATRKHTALNIKQLPRSQSHSPLTEASSSKPTPAPRTKRIVEKKTVSASDTEIPLGGFKTVSEYRPIPHPRKLRKSPRLQSTTTTTDRGSPVHQRVLRSSRHKDIIKQESVTPQLKTATEKAASSNGRKCKTNIVDKQTVQETSNLTVCRKRKTAFADKSAHWKAEREKPSTIQVTRQQTSDSIVSPTKRRKLYQLPYEWKVESVNSGENNIMVTLKLETGTQEMSPLTVQYLNSVLTIGSSCYIEQHISDSLSPATPTQCPNLQQGSATTEISEKSIENYKLPHISPPHHSQSKDNFDNLHKQPQTSKSPAEKIIKSPKRPCSIHGKPKKMFFGHRSPPISPPESSSSFLTSAPTSQNKPRYFRPIPSRQLNELQQGFRQLSLRSENLSPRIASSVSDTPIIFPSERNSSPLKRLDMEGQTKQKSLPDTTEELVSSDTVSQIDVVNIVSADTVTAGEIAFISTFQEDRTDVPVVSEIYTKYCEYDSVKDSEESMSVIDENGHDTAEQRKISLESTRIQNSDGNASQESNTENTKLKVLTTVSEYKFVKDSEINIPVFNESGKNMTEDRSEPCLTRIGFQDCAQKDIQMPTEETEKTDVHSTYGEYTLKVRRLYLETTEEVITGSQKDESLESKLEETDVHRTYSENESVEDSDDSTLIIDESVHDSSNVESIPCKTTEIQGTGTENIRSEGLERGNWCVEESEDSSETPNRNERRIVRQLFPDFKFEWTVLPLEPGEQGVSTKLRFEPDILPKWCTFPKCSLPKPVSESSSCINPSGHSDAVPDSETKRNSADWRTSSTEYGNSSNFDLTDSTKETILSKDSQNISEQTFVGKERNVLVSSSVPRTTDAIFASSSSMANLSPTVKGLAVKLATAVSSSNTIPDSNSKLADKEKSVVSLAENTVLSHGETNIQTVADSNTTSDSGMPYSHPTETEIQLAYALSSMATSVSGSTKSRSSRPLSTNSDNKDMDVTGSISPVSSATSTTTTFPYSGNISTLSGSDSSIVMGITPLTKPILNTSGSRTILAETQIESAAASTTQNSANVPLPAAQSLSLSVARTKILGTVDFMEDPSLPGPSLTFSSTSESESKQSCSSRNEVFNSTMQEVESALAEILETLENKLTSVGHTDNNSALDLSPTIPVSIPTSTTTEQRLTAHHTAMAMMSSVSPLPSSDSSRRDVDSDNDAYILPNTTSTVDFSILHTPFCNETSYAPRSSNDSTTRCENSDTSVAASSSKSRPTSDSEDSNSDANSSSSSNSPLSGNPRMSSDAGKG